MFQVGVWIMDQLVVDLIIRNLFSIFLEVIKCLDFFSKNTSKLILSKDLIRQQPGQLEGKQVNTSIV